jgi:hypothetical protein
LDCGKLSEKKYFLLLLEKSDIGQKLLFFIHHPDHSNQAVCFFKTNSALSIEAIAP